MSFIKELKRRNVFKVGAAYLAVAWLIAQVSELALSSFGAPDWIIRTELFLLAVGFPVALVFAWAFELTPEGIKRDTDAKSSRIRNSRPWTYARLRNYCVAGTRPGLLYLGAAASDFAQPEVLDRSIAVLPFRRSISRFRAGMVCGWPYGRNNQCADPDARPASGIKYVSIRIQGFK